MKIAFCSDHRGYELKEKLIKLVKDRLKVECVDVGCNSKDRCDYPEYAFKLGELIKNKEADYGVSICGSGDGMCIACNKVKGVRATLTRSASQANLAKAHDDINVVAIGADSTSLEESFAIVEALLTTAFLEERHLDRVKMIEAYEQDR